MGESPASAPTNPRCEYHVNPLGLDVRRPRLSWELNDPRRGARQSAHQVLVASRPELLTVGQADVWDSGVVRTDRSIHVVYGGPPLESSRRYHWTVRTWDRDERASDYAPPAWWEMGLLEPGHWRARWISTPSDGPEFDDDGRRLPCRSQYMRREFTLDQEAVSARVYVSGLGCYELHINCQRVGEDIFTPGWTVYEKRTQYQTYDVTSLLRPGPNALAAILGNAWWSGGLGIGRGNSERASTGNQRLILQLRIDCADGTARTVVTDQAWRAADSPVLADSFYGGETYDARLEQPGWNEPGFDAAAWQPVIVLDDPVDRLVAQQTYPIRVTGKLPAVDVARPEPGIHVFDFGQNHAGRCRLLVRGGAGDRVRLRFAEVLDADGRLDRRNLRGAECTDEYILRGEEDEIWEPRFTYRGYRYVELTGYPGEPSWETLQAKAVHSAVPWAGEFECSNELLNRVQQLTLWAQRSNMHSVPTDCPQRDERLGWLGDAHVFAPTGCWNMDLATFMTKWLRDIRDSQGTDGHIRDVAPAVVVKGPAAPGWGDAITGVPMTLHQFHGDTRVLEENYDAMRAWVEYMRARAPGDIYICPHTYQEHGYGDWVAPVESPRKPIATAFYYYSTTLLAQAAAIIGRDDDVREYLRLGDDIRVAFNGAFFDRDTNNYEGATQTANILPLAFGLTPPRRRKAVLANVVRDIEARDGHLSTGFLGTAYLLPLLSEGGHHELAYRVATQRTHPSWGYMLECGATTMCERWNPDTGDLRMNSWNHFALGAIGQWFYEDLAGIGFDHQSPSGANHLAGRRFVIRPRPAGDLRWARASHASMYGPVRSAWQRESDCLRFDVTIPANCSARICVPTIGYSDATVFESGKRLVESGAVADRAEGLQFVNIDSEGFAVFEAEAGSYRFTVS